MKYPKIAVKTKFLLNWQLVTQYILCHFNWERKKKDQNSSVITRAQFRK